MTMTNHMLTGSIIALALQQPMLAVPLAFLSHFVLDALPHYGEKDSDYQFSQLSRAVIIIDLLIAGCFLLWLITSGNLLLAVCAFAAASPDAVWGYRLLCFHFGKIAPKNALTKFHSWVQWRERPWGLAVEFVYLVLAIGVFRGLQ